MFQLPKNQLMRSLEAYIINCIIAKKLNLMIIHSLVEFIDYIDNKLTTLTL